MKKRIIPIITLIMLLSGVFIFRSPIAKILKSGIFKTLPPVHVNSSLPSKYAELLSQQEKTFLFKDVTVIPVDQDTILHHKYVLVKDGIITQIADSLKHISQANYAFIIEGKNKFLIPGLSDMHSHINDDNNLLLFLCHGVTTTRNMAGFPFHLEMKSRLESGKILGPHLYTSSPILEGPHQIWKNSAGSIKIKSSTEIEQLIVKLKGQGYRYIKVYHTLAPEFYREIQRVADSLNLLTMGHMPIDVEIEEFLTLSQYCVEHIEIGQLNLISPEISLEEKARLLGESDKWICPTLIVHKKMTSNPGEPGLPLYFEDFVDRRTLRFWRARLKDGNNEFALRQKLAGIMYKEGARFITGTDCLNAYILSGFSLHEELEEMQRFGLSPYEVLRASTVNTAEFLGKLDHSGTIEEGKIADLVLLSKNPLENISHTQSIEGVMTQGRWLGKNLIAEILEEIKKSYDN